MKNIKIFGQKYFFRNWLESIDFGSEILYKLNIDTAGITILLR